MGLAHGSGGTVPEPLSCAAEVSPTSLTKPHEVLKMLELNGRSHCHKAVEATTECTDNVWRAEQKSQSSLVV